MRIPSPGNGWPTPPGALPGGQEERAREFAGRGEVLRAWHGAGPVVSLQIGRVVSRCGVDGRTQERSVRRLRNLIWKVKLKLRGSPGAWEDAR